MFAVLNFLVIFSQLLYIIPFLVLIYCHQNFNAIYLQSEILIKTALIKKCISFLSPLALLRKKTIRFVMSLRTYGTIRLHWAGFHDI
jgi:hypothetical protein